MRHRMTHAAESSGAVSRDTVEDFVMAANEILVNALTHGGAPVELVMSVDLARLTCRITRRRTPGSRTR